MILLDDREWAEEYENEDAVITDDDALLSTFIARGWSLLKAGRMAIEARERHDAPEEILPPNLMLLNAGASVEIIHKIKAKTRLVKIGGKEYQMPAYVGSVPVGPLGEDGQIGAGSYVPAENPLAVERCVAYVENVVPGHIWNRLLILRDNGIPLTDIAERLKRKIDEMVDELEAVVQVEPEAVAAE